MPYSSASETPCEERSLLTTGPCLDVALGVSLSASWGVGLHSTVSSSLLAGPFLTRAAVSLTCKVKNFDDNNIFFSRVVAVRISLICTQG